jgi:glycosyltransferase involved in cell wall biosynthesis
MKVALFHPEFKAPRGAENLILTFADALLEVGVEVRLVSFEWDADVMGRRMTPYGPRRIPAPRTSWSGRPDSRTLSTLRESVEGFSVVMAHNHPSNAYLGLCGFAGKTLWYCHEPHRSLFAEQANPAMASALAEGRLDKTGAMGQSISGALRRSRWKRLLSPHHRGRIVLDRSGVAKLDAIWANSAATAGAVASIYGREAEVFYPGVELGDEIPPPALWEQPLRVLVMGGFGAYKGLSALLAGAARHLNENPGTLVLDIVGQGRELPMLKGLAGRLGLGGAAIFHGYLPPQELAALKSRCHGFAAMPGDEPFGLVFAEAAGAGLVLMGPDHGGPLEILDQGRAGILADPFEPPAIARAFQRFCSLDPAERGALRRAAFDSAKARFDVAGLGRRLMVHLEALLGRP